MSVRKLSVSLLLFAAGGIACAADTADAAAGQEYFMQTCRMCHSAKAGDGGGEIGPTLFDLPGRQAGIGDKAFVYSMALKDSKLVWNKETLDRFLEDPGSTVPGTTMPMPVPAKKDRDNVIAFFQSLATSGK